jgi:hypothetical protein
LLEAPFRVWLCLAVLVPGTAAFAGWRVARSVNRRRLSSHYTRTRTVSGRGAGALAGALTVAGTLAAILLTPPRSWPASVDAAVAVAMDSLDESDLRSITYMGIDDLSSMHFGLGMWMRNGFGLWSGNWRLMSDCGETHPDDCSGVIIHRLWNRLRADLPGPERAALERLERQMASVTAMRLDFNDAEVTQIAAAINDAVAGQLPESDRFVVRVDPAFAESRISWTDPDESEFPFALVRLEANTFITVRKAPPDLVLEPDLWPMSPELPNGAPLKPLISLDYGLREQRLGIVTDSAAWTKTWKELSDQARLSQPVPPVDFNRSTVLIIALGRRPSAGYRVKVEAGGSRNQVAHFTIDEEKPGENCQTGLLGTYPTYVYVVPAQLKAARFWELHGEYAC